MDQHGLSERTLPNYFDLPVVFHHFLNFFVAEFKIKVTFCAKFWVQNIKGSVTHPIQIPPRIYLYIINRFIYGLNYKLRCRTTPLHTTKYPQHLTLHRIFFPPNIYSNINPQSSASLPLRLRRFVFGRIIRP